MLGPETLEVVLGLRAHRPVSVHAGNVGLPDQFRRLRKHPAFSQYRFDRRRHLVFSFECCASARAAKLGSLQSFPAGAMTKRKVGHDSIVPMVALPVTCHTADARWRDPVRPPSHDPARSSSRPGAQVPSTLPHRRMRQCTDGSSCSISITFPAIGAGDYGPRTASCHATKTAAASHDGRHGNGLPGVAMSAGRQGARVLPGVAQRDTASVGILSAPPGVANRGLAGQ